MRDQDLYEVESGFRMIFCGRWEAGAHRARRNGQRDGARAQLTWTTAALNTVHAYSIVLHPLMRDFARGITLSRASGTATMAPGSAHDEALVG